MKSAKWILLLGLLVLAFGVESIENTEEGRTLVRLTAAGALFAFFVLAYLWWKIMAAVVRLLLLVVACGVVLYLMSEWSLLPGLS